ncbi:EAL domain-containing protein, partial [Enterococcus faecium]|uniref:EAL domain-containing protein n=1 Tax=Enterococcus faecium TaxID=1352 RepID=UPI00116087AD
LLAQMRGLGLRVAMDDFGTGYSSLSALKHAPVDIVKIDRSFVQGLCGSAFDHSFVHLMVELCHSVGIRVCVEGVETTAELATGRPSDSPAIKR